MTDSDIALEIVLRSLRAKGYVALECASEDLPDILIADEKIGFLAIDVLFGKEIDEFSEEQRKRRQVKVLKNLRIELEINKDVTIRFLRLTVPQIPELFRGNPRKILALSLIQGYESNPISTELINRAVERFDPAFVFVSEKRERTQDSQEVASRRQKMRFRLDNYQKTLAATFGDSNVFVRGVAGSGKTLVLAARARLLTSEHPEWRIRVVCFNKSLKRLLENLLKDLKRVTVETFYEYTLRTGDGFRQIDSTEFLSDRELHLHRQSGIKKSADAVLVDEVQDFFPAWIKYLHETLIPNRGGMFVVGDENQALYRDTNLVKLFTDLGFDEHYLAKPYRSTKQILRVVQALLPEVELPGVELSLDGPEPELIYVTSGSVATHQARAIYEDINYLRETRQNVQWSDFGLLFTLGAHLKGVTGELSRLFQANLGVSRNLNPVFKGLGDTLDLNSDTIKLMTMASAKGLEFRFVFLVGLDRLADGIEETKKNFTTEESARQARLNLVGPTRAKEQLNLYYSRDNVFLKRLIGKEHLVKIRRYPDDYEGVQG
jgi:superfamily I DNA/RNA helicase